MTSMWMRKLLYFGAVSAVALAIVSASAKPIRRAPLTELEPWLKLQESASISRMFANISPSGAALGAVIASPERVRPNYFFHWVRDASLTMDTVVSLYSDMRGSVAGRSRAQLRDMLFDFAR